MPLSGDSVEMEEATLPRRRRDSAATACAINHLARSPASVTDLPGEADINS